MLLVTPDDYQSALLRESGENPIEENIFGSLKGLYSTEKKVTAFLDRKDGVHLHSQNAVTC